MWQCKKRVQRENDADKQTGQISGQKDSMIQTKKHGSTKKKHIAQDATNTEHNHTSGKCYLGCLKLF